MKKRILGVLNIKDNNVVQSFGYSKFLPQGRIEDFVENLNRWGVDEILVNDIDRSKKSLGPNIELLSRVSNLKINTPIIYAGNINNTEDAINAIKNGADRIVLGNLFFKNFDEIKNISNALGSQALIISLSLIFENNQIYMNNYVDQKVFKFDKKKILLLKNFISELLLIDTQNEGYEKAFNQNLLKKIIKMKLGIPKILFGGISDSSQIIKLTYSKNVSAIAIGNFLSYKEHAYQKIIEKFSNKKFRREFYEKD